MRTRLYRQTARMLVRPLVAEDRAGWIAACVASDAVVAPWSPARPPGFTWEAQFDRVLAQNGTETALRLAGFLPDGRVAGLFSLTEISRGPFQNAYGAWSVNAAVAGQGLATEGVAAMLEVAFNPAGLALHRVQANVIPRNLRSVRVAEKCGFRLEGTALRYLQIAGRWEDHAMYARLCDEP